MHVKTAKTLDPPQLSQSYQPKFDSLFFYDLKLFSAS